MTPVTRGELIEEMREFGIHPSGTTEPSSSDQVLTYALSDALDLIDVRVLDHFVVGGHTALSFRERSIPLRRPAPEPEVRKPRRSKTK